MSRRCEGAAVTYQKHRINTLSCVYEFTFRDEDLLLLFQKEDTLFVTYKSHRVEFLFSAFDSSCSEEQWTANVQHPGTRSRSSSALLVRDTDELISL